MAYKISVDKDKCIGCGACTSCDNFKMDDDYKSKPVKTMVDQLTCEKEAEKNCPVEAIKVEEVLD